MSADTPTFPPLTKDQIGSPEKTAEAIRLYSLFAELLDSKHFKILKAAAKYFETKITPTNSECEGKKANADDDAVSIASSNASECSVQSLKCDYQVELAELQKMNDLADLKMTVVDADRAFGKKYRAAMKQYDAAFPTGAYDVLFSKRLIEHINTVLDPGTLRMATGPISCQFKTGESSDEEIAEVATRWACGSIYNNQHHFFKDCLDYLTENYIQADTWDTLKEQLEEREFEGELTELHPDLETEDLVILASDAINEPLRNRHTGNTRLGLAAEWPLQNEDKLQEQFRTMITPPPDSTSQTVSRRNYSRYTPQTSGVMDDPNRLTNDAEGPYKLTQSIPVIKNSSVLEDSEWTRGRILDRAIEGDFTNAVKKVYGRALAQNSVELIYSCWSYMLSDISEGIRNTVEDVRKEVLSQVQNRLVVRNRAHVPSSRASSSSCEIVVDD